MNEKLAVLFKEVICNEKFVEELKAKKSMDEFYNYCVSKVDGYTYDEFIEFMRAIAEYVSGSKKLSDDELSDINGGFKLNSKYSKALSSIIATGALAAAGLVMTSATSNNRAAAYNYGTSQATQVSSDKEFSNVHVKELVKKFNDLDEKNREKSKQKSTKTSTTSTGTQTRTSGTQTSTTGTQTSTTGTQTGGSSTSPFDGAKAGVQQTQKKTPSAYYWPNLSLTYGQKLSQTKFEGGSFSVPGSVYFTSSTYLHYVPNAGKYRATIVFTPYDTANYESISQDIYINVHKADPGRVNASYTRTYRKGLKLSDFTLPGDWRWENPQTSINQAGDMYFKAIHPESRNYVGAVDYVKVHIDQAEPELRLNSITYRENLRVSDIQLPAGWHLDLWGNLFSQELKAGDNYFYADYDGAYAGTNVYKDRRGVKVCIKVDQAPAKIDIWPSAAERITYGESLSKISLVNGKSPIDGNFYWKDPKQIPTVKNSGYEVVFFPNNPNYKSVTQRINVFVNKNITPRDSKSPTLSNSYAKKVALDKFTGYEYSMDNGKTWQDSSEFSGLEPDTDYNFAARIKESDNECAGKISKTLTVHTKKLQTSKPKELVVDKVTNHKITFKEIDDQEYSKDGGKTWQDSPEFTDLSGSTKYDFTTRIKANTVYDSSEATPSVTVKTKSFLGNAWSKIKSWFKGS